LQEPKLFKKELKETQKLQQKIQEFARKGEQATKKEEEEYDQAVGDLRFKIEILTQRAARHEEMALEKYADLDKRLMEHDKLSILRNQK